MVLVYIYTTYIIIYIYVYIPYDFTMLCTIRSLEIFFSFLFFSFFFPSRRLIDRMNDDATRVSMSMRYTYVYNMYMRAWMYCSNVHKVIINVRTIDIIARVRRVLFIRMCMCVCIYSAYTYTNICIYLYIYKRTMNAFI